MSDDVVIKIDGVFKDFKLPHEKADSVKSLFVNPLRAKTRYEVQHALKDINIEVKKGEFFGIVGRNGSGKSTLLKILAGIYQPTKGSVSTQGKLVPFIELGVGFNPELTGRENVYLNGAMMGFSKKETDAMYDDIVAFAELEEFMDQKLKNYSSGMQVRLAFSVAIKAEADILLVDEVLAVGDTAFQRKCYEYFKSLKKDKKTVVFVSHDMSAVREYCDRVALIETSELKAVGAPTKIADRYNRLFTRELAEVSPSADNRWGNGSVKIKNLELGNNSLTDKDKELCFTVTLEAQKDLETIMTGFRVINAAGQSLHETNTWNEGTWGPRMKRGDICTVVWQIQNIYADGRYALDVYVHDDKGDIAETWSEAAFFQSTRPQLKGFLMAPPVKLTLK